MGVNELITKLEELGEREVFVEVTVHYLLSLPPELADAAFRAGILRWFNPDTLQAVLGEGTVSGIETLLPHRTVTSNELYDQLRNLGFAEEYYGRGFRFHDLTRESILRYLWQNERNFYCKVSAKAVDHFAALLNAQIKQTESDETGPSGVDWELIVEIAYHYFIRNEQEAVAVVDDYLDRLNHDRRLGTYHAVIQAISEHSKAGRITGDTRAWIQLWKLREAYATYDMARLETIAQKLRQSSQASVPAWMKAEATYLVASGLIFSSRYDEAITLLKENVRQYEDLKDMNGVVRAVNELGRIDLYQGEFDKAIARFADALSLHVQQLRVPAAEDFEYGNDTPLAIFSPEAWHRRELYRSDDEQAQTDGSPPETSERELPNQVVFYFVKFDTEELGIDTLALSEDEVLRYQWPINFDDLLAQIWLNLGYSEQGRDRFDVAAACARLAGQMYSDLDVVEGTQSAVQLLRSLGANIGDLEFVKAMEDVQYELLSAAIARGNRRAELSGLITHANSRLEMEKYEEAWRKYEEANSLAQTLDLTNEKAACLDGFARLLWIRGEYEQARRRFSEALRLYEDVQNREGCADTLLIQGDLYLDTNQFAQAEKCFEEAFETYNSLKQFVGRFDALLRLSEVAEKKGDYDGSFRFLSEALKLSRARADTHLSSEALAISQTAQLHLSLGQFDQAKEAFAQALNITERIGNQRLSARILLKWGDVLSDLAAYTEAVRVYEQAIEFDASDSSGYSGKAWALENAGKERALEARQSYEKASEVSPSDWWIHKGIANALRLSGDKHAAVIKYRWVADQIEQLGVQPVHRSTLAWCYYHLGEYEKAEIIYRQVVASDSVPISDYFDLGLVLLCRKLFSEALTAYGKAIDLLQWKRPPLRRLGLIHVAIDDLREIVETDPSLSDVQVVSRIREELTEQQRLAKDSSNVASALAASQSY